MEEFDDEDFNVSFGEDKSTASVLNETIPSVNQSQELESSFEIDNWGLTSTPKKTRKSKSDSVFKQPRLPPVYFGLCPHCRRGLKTKRGLENHIQAHKWKELTLRKPSAENVVGFCCEELQNILKRCIINEEQQVLASTSTVSLRRKQLICCMKDLSTQSMEQDWKNFSCKLCEIVSMGLSYGTSPATFPSTLRQSIQKSLSAAFASEVFRKGVLEAFQKLTNCSDSIAWSVIFALAKNVTSAAITYIAKSMMGTTDKNTQNPQGRTKCRDDFNHHRSQQVVHYAAGSALRGHLRNACRYPRNKRMRNIRDCILSKFADIGGPAVSDKKDPAYWTSLMNRKSLLFVKSEALPFFLEICKILASVETVDGKLGHDMVMEKVISHGTPLLLWDSIVESSLTEDESFSFMVKVIRSVSNTYGKGMMIRRMNQQWREGKGNKATISVSHRARLI